MIKKTSRSIDASSFVVYYDFIPMFRKLDNPTGHAIKAG